MKSNYLLELLVIPEQAKDGFHIKIQGEFIKIMQCVQCEHREIDGAAGLSQWQVLVSDLDDFIHDYFLLVPLCLHLCGLLFECL